MSKIVWREDIASAPMCRLVELGPKAKASRELSRRLAILRSLRAFLCFANCRMA
jgi:hypothetical protein